MLEPDLYTIGEVAAIVGVSPHTIRAWERRHGIVRPLRTHSRQRRYRREDVELLRDVKRAISVDGLSLKLAFQKVTGTQETEAPRSATPGAQRQRRAWPLPSDAGVWHAVADALPQLVLIIDARGTIREANVATARAFGVVRQRLAGRTFADLIDPFDRAKGVLIYRPRPRTVRDWELNLKTAGGVRLYSFQSWPVKEGETQSIALVGTEMFESGSPPGPASVPGELTRIAAGGATGGDVFQTLVEQLPFGVIVATIGVAPRVVYANRRMAEALGLSTLILAGTPVGDLLPASSTGEAFAEAVATGDRQTVGAVAPVGSEGAGRLVNVAFQPMQSSSRKIASMLLLVEDVTAQAAERRQLEYLLAEQPFGEPKTIEDLARMGYVHLSRVFRGVEFVLMIRGYGAGEPAIISTRGVAAAPDAVDDAYVEVIDRVLQGGRAAHRPLAVGSRRDVITAIPVGARRRMGVLAWRLPGDQALPAEQRSAAHAVAASLAVAAQLLHAQADASRRAAHLEHVVNAAAVVREPNSRTGLGVRFLERLLETVRADGAAIGRIEAGDFVVEVAYATFGAHAKPGDRFPLAGQFVSDSMRTGEVTETRVLGSRRLPQPVRKSLSRMSRGLSVPLVVEGEIPHVLTLVRMADIPFVEEDVRIVQALSGVALLAVAMEASNAGAEVPPKPSGR